MLSSILRYNTIMILMQLLRYLMKFFSWKRAYALHDYFLNWRLIAMKEWASLPSVFPVKFTVYNFVEKKVYTGQLSSYLFLV